MTDANVIDANAVAEVAEQAAGFDWGNLLSGGTANLMEIAGAMIEPIASGAGWVFDKLANVTPAGVALIISIIIATLVFLRLPAFVTFLQTIIKFIALLWIIVAAALIIGILFGFITI